MLERHCADLGRDVSEIRKSANAMFLVTDDSAAAEEAKAQNPRLLAGSASELQAVVQEYIDAGVDELVVPIFQLRGDQNADRAKGVS